MKYLSELTVLAVAIINCIAIIAYCVREKKQPRKDLICGIIILSALCIFDIAVGIYFYTTGVPGNMAVFALFIPLIGMLFYADIRELRSK